MSEQQSEIIAKFASLTNADEEQARFYMESTNWDLNMALANFYEDRDHDAAEPSQESSSDRPVVPPAAASVPQSSSSTSKKPEKKTVIKSTGNVRTLSNFRQSQESSDSSDNEQGQAFYAGGSEHSGQQVLGPSRARRGDIVTEMFRSVRELGAEVVEPHSSNSKGRQSFVFGGTGYRLGETANDSEVVTPKKSETTSPYYEVTLRFWKNGFSVNDGPLQSYEDPKSQETLRLIQHGKIPNEIIMQAEGREINFNLEDFRHSDYVGKPTKINKFAGTGQKLGSVTPTLTSPTPANDSSSNSDNSVQPNPIKIDDNKPKTNIQIRLADGSRLVGTFNHDHTIGDLRSFINASSPQSRNRNYILLSSFPRKELVNDESTIEESGLVNAVVMQHLSA